MLSTVDDLPQRDRWARLRFAIVGPLLAAPPVAGELHEALNAAEAVQALTAQYREHPGWTAQVHYDNLRVALGVAGTKSPSYPSVRR